MKNHEKNRIFILGAGFFTPILGEDFHFDEHIFSDGLFQPPTAAGVAQWPQW